MLQPFLLPRPHETAPDTSPGHGLGLCVEGARKREAVRLGQPEGRMGSSSEGAAGPGWQVTCRRSPCPPAPTQLALSFLPLRTPHPRTMRHPDPLHSSLQTPAHRAGKGRRISSPHTRHCPPGQSGTESLNNSPNVNNLKIFLFNCFPCPAWGPLGWPARGRGRRPPGSSAGSRAVNQGLRRRPARGADCK